MSYGQGQMRTRARMGKDRLQVRTGKHSLGARARTSKCKDGQGQGWARARIGKDNDRLGQLELDANSFG